MLQARNVSVKLGSRQVLDDVSIDVPAGQLTVIVGHNGAGKSTLVRVFSGELAPASGSVTVAGRPIRAMPPHELSAIRSVMPQATRLAFPFLVEEVVALGVSVPGFRTDDEARLIRSSMDMAGVGHLAQNLYTQISGGERQRVHFARAMCQLLASRASPEDTILLLDEPTSNLDLPHQMALMRCAHTEARRGRTVIAVLHDLNLAATWGDQVLALGDGRVASFGKPVDVLTTKTLSAVYGWPIEVSTSSAGGLPVILPQSMRSLEGMSTARS